MTAMSRQDILTPLIAAPGTRQADRRKAPLDPRPEAGLHLRRPLAARLPRHAGLLDHHRLARRARDDLAEDCVEIVHAGVELGRREPALEQRVDVDADEVLRLEEARLALLAGNTARAWSLFEEIGRAHV